MNIRHSFLPAITMVLALLFPSQPAADIFTDPFCAEVPDSLDLSNAAAVVLLDAGELVVLPSGKTVSRCRTVVKILDQRGKGRAEVSLPCSSAFDEIKLLHARTIRVEGDTLIIQRTMSRWPANYAPSSYDFVRAELAERDQLRLDTVVVRRRN